MNSTSVDVGKTKSSLVAAVRERWETIEPRSRTVLLISIAALLLGLLYAYVWLPAARGRALNAARIPVLEAKLATMRTEVAEMKRILAVPPNVSTASTTPTSARASASNTAEVAGLQSIFGTTAKITVDENRAFRINISSISYTSFLDRLDQVLSRYRLKVDALNITALNTPISTPAKTTEAAMVTVDITLGADTSAGKP